MKANKVITIALTAICGAAIMSVGSAFAADESVTYYPVKTVTDGKEVQPFEKSLTFDVCPVNDYAISGNNYAFASGTSLFVLYNDTNGERCLAGDEDNPINARSRIERVEYTEDKLYVEVEDGNTYLYPDLSNAVDYKIAENENKHVILSSREEYRLLNNELCYISGDSLDNLGEGYSLIKAYGDKAYAVKENVLYSFDKANGTAVNLSYTNFDEADRILAGDAVNILKDAKNYQVKWATIKADCYYTQIDTRKFIDGKFVQLAASEGGKRTRKSSGGVNCLVLGTSGNATIIANDDGCYITATENLENHDYSKPLNDWKLNAEDKRIAYAISDCGVYSSPYMCELTKVATLTQGSEHPVEVIEKFTLPFIKTTFYKVKYTESENEITGFVALNNLMEYSFSAEDNPPHEGGDEKFDYDTNVVSVVLAIVIVGLVMIAGMYLFLICTNKGKPKKQKKEKKKKPEPVSDPEPYDEED